MFNRRQFFSGLGGGLLATAVPWRVIPAGPITGVLFFSGDLWIAQESQLIRLDANTLNELERFDLPLAKTTRLIQSADDRLQVAGGFPAERGVWLEYQWRDGELIELARFEQDSDLFADMVTIGNPRLVWLAGRDQRITVIDPAAAMPQITQLEAHSAPVTRLLAINDATVVSASLDQSLKVWNASDLLLKRELPQHVGGVVDALQVAAAGTQPQIVSLGLDRTVRLWQPLIGRMVRFARLDEVATLLFPGVTERDPGAAPAPNTVWAAARTGDLWEIDLQKAIVTRTLPTGELPWTAAMRIKTNRQEEEQADETQPTAQQVLLGGALGDLRAIRLED